MSSIRIPGSRASLRQISSSLARWASSTFHPFLEQRAAVGHRLVEEEGEELVRDVVVVAHRLRVTALGVPVTAGLELGGGWSGQASEPGCPHRGGPESKPGSQPQRRRAPAPEQRHDSIEVVEGFAPGEEVAGLADLPVAEVGVDGSQRLSNRHARAFNSSDGLSEHHDTVSAVPKLAYVELEVVEVVGPLGQQRPQPIRTSILGLPDPLGVGMVDGIRSKRGPRRVDSPGSERLVGLAHQLHVLLRHRLLREPRGFEGLGSFQI